MLSLFKKRHSSVASIDISSSSVKMLETVNVNGVCQINSFARDALRPGIVEGTAIKDIEAVSASIRRAVINGQIAAKEAIIAVPDAAAITKIIQINSGLNEQEIEELIAFEAEKHFPYPLDEINLDFHVIGPFEKNPKMLEVVVVGARTEIVNSRVDAVRMAGLEVNIVDIVSCAAARSVYHYIEQELPSLSTDKKIALFYFGEQETNFYVLKNKYVTYTRDEEFGTKQLLDTIMHNYAMTYEDAARMLFDNAYPADFDEVILQPFRESLLLQIRRTLQFYFSTAHHEQFEQIFLVGAVSKIKSVLEVVSEKTGIPTCSMNPLTGMTLRQNVNKPLLESEASDFFIAAGLSLRENVSI